MAEDSRSKGSPPPKLNLKGKVLQAKAPAAGSVSPIPEESKKVAPPAAPQEAPTILKTATRPATGAIKLKPATQSAAAVQLKADSDTKTVKAQKPLSAKPINLTSSAGEDSVAKAKKQTSRIPLEAATAFPGLGGEQSSLAPKTIRIKPTASQTAQISIGPLGGPAVNEKRKTSRISLESALSVAGKNDAAEESTPKTIKLKRPTEPAVKPSVAQGGPAMVITKTAQLDDIIESEDGQTPTKRRTIKVKRPTQSPGRAPVTISRAGGESDGTVEETFTEESAETSSSPLDEPHLAFSLVTLAAILIVIITLYMFMAQVFGVNVSLTQLSYGAPGLDLGWPGKISTGL
ncbi:MAG: hypothetical protein JXN60_07450 [Lentisphaerae bacterium]|nr:hypothetical protein [Lentisphaerota bacterium]